MKCDMCGNNQASVHLTEVINDKVTKLHLCEECAKIKSEEMQSHFGLTDLLAGLMDLGPAMSEDGVDPSVTVQCPVCLMTYYDFQKNGKLGCGKCYDIFQRNLSELLRKIHGADRHVGKMPFAGKKIVEEQKDMQKIRSELNELIKKEEFEKAAILRDRIKDLEKEMENEAGAE
ncbi:MAG: UvrB/UvrC motif-containing protein [Candidatus Omnitrophica bacterium]|nr:UvrB/UvrC motif-containing protein [Candidatus Omnitrophota bacterium]